MVHFDRHSGSVKQCIFLLYLLQSRTPNAISPSAMGCWAQVDVILPALSCTQSSDEVEVICQFVWISLDRLVTDPKFSMHGNHLPFGLVWTSTPNKDCQINYSSTDRRFHQNGAHRSPTMNYCLGVDKEQSVSALLAELLLTRRHY